ncbi:MAG: VIT1/CCC1 transporter family protein [Dehalococcoidia bacterium]
MLGKFFRGFVDGSLSTLGIVIGAYSASSSVIIAAGIGGALANGIFNVLSAFSAERADQYRELRKIESAMVAKELKDSEVEFQIQKNTLRAGTVDGLATIIGGAVPVLPYIWLDSSDAMFVASGLVIVGIFAIGIYLGKLSRRNILLYGAKMALFGAVTAVLVYLIQWAIIPASD